MRSGGFEEVIDFRNKEIGYFTWNGHTLGTSAVGVATAGYFGWGYKGYKQEWSQIQRAKTITKGQVLDFLRNRIVSSAGLDGRGPSRPRD